MISSIRTKLLPILCAAIALAGCPAKNEPAAKGQATKKASPEKKREPSKKKALKKPQPGDDKPAPTRDTPLPPPTIPRALAALIDQWKLEATQLGDMPPKPTSAPGSLTLKKDGSCQEVLYGKSYSCRFTLEGRALIKQDGKKLFRSHIETLSAKKLVLLTTHKGITTRMIYSK